MSEALLRKLWDVERTIKAEEKELCMLVIELAKEVHQQRQEIDTLKAGMKDSIRGIYDSPAYQAASLLIPLGGKP